MFKGGTYVKSPVASLTLTCSSVKKRVRVTMLVLMVSASLPLPLVFTCADIVAIGQQETQQREQENSNYQADCLRTGQDRADELGRNMVSTGAALETELKEAMSRIKVALIAGSVDSSHGEYELAVVECEVVVMSGT